VSSGTSTRMTGISILPYLQACQQDCPKYPNTMAGKFHNCIHAIAS
jgi:hypothetical protein